MTPVSNFMEICRVGAKLIHADRQTDKRTDMKKLIGAVRDCRKRPNNTNGIGIPHA
jgi:hypothetical protein